MLIHFYKLLCDCIFSCVGVCCYICSWVLCVRLQLVFWIIIALALWEITLSRNYIMRRLDWMFIISDLFFIICFIAEQKAANYFNFPHNGIFVNKWGIYSSEKRFLTLICHENLEQSEAHNFLFQNNISE